MQKLLGKKKVVMYGALALAGIVLAGETVYADDKVVFHSPQVGQTQVSADQRMEETEKERENAESRTPMLDSRDQLPGNFREMLESRGNGDKVSQAYGDMWYPFTTKLAGTSTSKYTKGKLKKELFRGVGKLWMRFDTSWYVCTASLIDKGVLVTAAHCVHQFGQEDEGWADEVLFQPARYDNKTPYGTWRGQTWAIPSVYYYGTDVCDAAAPGVVCENDLAVVVLQKKRRKHLGQKVFKYGDMRRGLYPYGAYSHASDDYSYVPFFTQDYLSTQITQFGYPVAMEDGYKPLRTDSLGMQSDPYNVIIGSDQTGGSSGGPWFVNFGLDYSSTSSTPYDPEMAIMAVTSWGYVDDSLKIQGASRFGLNTTYTSVSNIDSLHSTACTLDPASCY